MRHYNCIHFYPRHILLIGNNISLDLTTKTMNKYANNMTEQHKRSIQRIQQATIVLFAVLCVVVGIGVYVYYCRQLKEHRKEWSWIDFVFAGCARSRRQGVR